MEMVYALNYTNSVGIKVLYESVKDYIIKKSILHKHFSVEVHVLTLDELEPMEDRSLAVDRSADTTYQLELLCGLHGNILNRLQNGCHLVSPIVMVKLTANRPLKVKLTMPHALTATKASKKMHYNEKLFTITTAAEEPQLVPEEDYKLESNNRCAITMVINKQRMFALTAMEDFTTHRGLPGFNVTRPLAIKCIYYVFSEVVGHAISVKVYCGIDLPITQKVKMCTFTGRGNNYCALLQLISDISKEQPKAQGKFTLSHQHIEISYNCAKDNTGWIVSDSSYEVLDFLTIGNFMCKSMCVNCRWKHHVSYPALNQNTCRILQHGSSRCFLNKMQRMCQRKSSVDCSSSLVDLDWLVMIFITIIQSLIMVSQTLIL